MPSLRPYETSLSIASSRTWSRALSIMLLYNIRWDATEAERFAVFNLEQCDGPLAQLNVGRPSLSGQVSRSADGYARPRILPRVRQRSWQSPKSRLDPGRHPGQADRLAYGNALETGQGAVEPAKLIPCWRGSWRRIARLRNCDAPTSRHSAPSPKNSVDAGAVVSD